jgi:hypothetical protein
LRIATVEKKFTHNVFAQETALHRVLCRNDPEKVCKSELDFDWRDGRLVAWTWECFMMTVDHDTGRPSEEVFTKVNNRIKP